MSNEPRLYSVALTASQYNLVMDILEERIEQFQDHPDAFDDGYYTPDHVERCGEVYDVLASALPPKLHAVAADVPPPDPSTTLTYASAWAGPLQCTPDEATHIARQERRLIAAGGVLVRMPVVTVDAVTYQLQRGDRIVATFDLDLYAMVVSPEDRESMMTDLYMRMLDRFADAA